VAEVEIRLDGESVATLDSPPWVAPLDLGPALAPHELVARALDERGAELARARQWINMPRPPAEAKILLERDASGRVKAASIAWQNLLGEAPSSVAVSFDGRPIAVDALRRVVIPAYAPEVSHILTVELAYESGMSSRDDLAIGGAAGDEAQSELTAVPVRRPGKGRLEPRAFDGMLRSGGKPLRVATVEEGGATLWIVRDESALEAYRKLREAGGDKIGRLFAPAALPLKKDDSVRFLWPRPRGVAGAAVPTALFPSSQEFTRKDGGLAFLLEHIANTEPAGLFPMYTDAVAVAGLNAFESFGRRAVLLVLGGDSPDLSTYKPPAVRRYLEILRVPLFVWSLDAEPPEGSPWGSVEAVGTSRGMRAAYERLRNALDSQAIVWVEGRLLPQEIEVRSADAEIERAR
jgi:hypothetical protein